MCVCVCGGFVLGVCVRGGQGEILGVKGAHKFYGVLNKYEV